MLRPGAVAALLLAPLVAAAQAPTAPASPSASPEADWSFGGGLSVTVFPALGASSSLLSTPSAVLVPAINASLERRWSSRTWLVVGAYGAVQRYRADVPAGSYGFARDDARTISLTGGFRRIVSGEGAPVDVSVLALAEAGIVDADQRLVSFQGESRVDSTTWHAGASAGIAIDRELTGGLSLRVASPLVGLSYDRGRLDEAGQPRRTTSGFVVRALLAPRLELRLAF